MKGRKTASRAEGGQVGSLAALGFLAVGLVSLFTIGAILMRHPEVLLGPLGGPEFLALAAVALPGVAGSLLFGAIYGLSPLFSSSSLWSARLAVVHLLAHLSGLLWMVASLGAAPHFGAQTDGRVEASALMLLGAILLIFNTLTTASRFNRWTVAQLAILSALFWLSLACLLLTAAPLDWLPGGLFPSGRTAAGAAMFFALAGFLWLALLGLTLQLLETFDVTTSAPGPLAWIGLCAVNLALLAALPLSLLGGTAGHMPAALGLILGSACLLADLARLAIRSRHRTGLAAVGALVGACLGWLLLARHGLGLWAPADGPSASSSLLERGSTALVLGLVPATLLGLGSWLVGLLVWRVRCVASAGMRAPTPLIRPGSQQVAMLCLLLASIYLYAGQSASQVAGIELGALCLLLGAFWHLHAVWPAIHLFCLGSAPSGEAHPAEDSATRPAG